MASDNAFPYWRRWQSLFENSPSYQQRNVINRDVGQRLMWNCTWCSLLSGSTRVGLLPGVEQPPAQPWGQKLRNEMGKPCSAVPQHCFSAQSKFSTPVKWCHSTNSITEGQKDAMKCPRLPQLRGRGAPWRPRHHPAYQDLWPIYQSRVLRAGAVPYSASLVPSTTCTITAQWRTSHSCSSHHLSLAENLHKKYCLKEFRKR